LIDTDVGAKGGKKGRTILYILPFNVEARHIAFLQKRKEEKGQIGP